MKNRDETQLSRRTSAVDGGRPALNTPAAVVDVLKRHVGRPELADLLGHTAAICRSPFNPMPLYRFADVCQRHGDSAGWHAAIDLALRLSHDTSEQLYFRARAKIRMGDWSGWSDYEARFFGDKFSAYQSAYARKLRWSFTAWDGEEDLRGRTLLVLFEQGFGDTIQMLRFIPALAKRADHIILSVQPLLLPLVQHNFGQLVTVRPSTATLPDAFDRYVWMMSLPAYIGSLPNFSPLIAPGPMDPFGRSDDRLHVGVCWAGNADYGRDDERSIPVTALEALFQSPDIRWHSLQVDRASGACERYHELLPPPSPLDSFAATANLISALDAVVSVDTAVCHLAASMGVPTVLCLDTGAVWRWGLEERTPWYPAMRIVRQREYGQWQSVLLAALGMLRGAVPQKLSLMPPSNLASA